MGDFREKSEDAQYVGLTVRDNLFAGVGVRLARKIPGSIDADDIRFHSRNAGVFWWSWPRYTVNERRGFILIPDTACPALARKLRAVRARSFPLPAGQQGLGPLEFAGGFANEERLMALMH